MADIRSLGKAGRHFTNWAKTYSCSPELYFEPENEDEIRKILAFAQKKGKKVRVVGYGHSPSDLACTTDYMISLNRFNKVLQIDKEKLQVTVQGGCLLRDLNNSVLPENGMAFSVQGSVADLTAAGVISTGTHGTGVNYGIISTFVKKLELMKANGEVISITPENQPDLFSASVLSLGSMGVILTVTFQCEKNFTLHQKEYPNTLKNVIENLNVYTNASDHFRFMWFPHTSQVICYNASRSNQEIKSKSSWFWDILVGYHLFQLILWISTFVPCLIPTINLLFFKLLCSKPKERTDRSDKIFNFNCLFKQYVMEWAIPREKTGVVLMELNTWLETSKFPAHLPIEVRFVKSDNIFLSPCYGRETCYINIVMYRPFNKFVYHETYWDAYQSIMAKHGGRPHWAKDHKLTGKDLQKLYPKWSEFCSIRDKFDPNGMFLNRNLEQVFGNRFTS